MTDVMTIETGVLVVGAGGAGMSAALAAAEAGAEVLLADVSLIGRGGATVMAQMTVAAALGEEEPDDWEAHFADTLRAGRGLCDPALAALLCRDAPARIWDLDGWGVGWARGDGHVRQVMAPGHDRRRCCYVDVLNTGPAVAGTLRKRGLKQAGIRCASNLMITDLALGPDGGVTGAWGYKLDDGVDVAIAAGAVVLAAGGLTKLFRRNSASANMGGHAHALALRAGARLIDMEFVQFFPIGHLAPRLVGMDPIMWDPFRYKLGGRLLNNRGEDFLERYGGVDAGVYRSPRDKTTYAITKEVEAGRGSPAGGVFLSFDHLPEEQLRGAFGPVIDKLLANGIDLKSQAVEVAPIAHYHMGGIEVDEAMRTGVDRLFAAGEAVGGANGANRLSGNAIPEALVFGEVAGRHAAAMAKSRPAALPGRRPRREKTGTGGASLLGEMESRLLDTMWQDVGPFRTGAALSRAADTLAELRHQLAGESLPETALPYDPRRLAWHDMDSALIAAEAVVTAALTRAESRGAHQRDDHPETDDRQQHSLAIGLQDGRPAVVAQIPRRETALA